MNQMALIKQLVAMREQINAMLAALTEEELAAVIASENTSTDTDGCQHPPSARRSLQTFGGDGAAWLCQDCGYYSSS